MVSASAIRFPNASTCSAMSVPKRAWTVIRSVSDDISSAMSTTAPRSASPSHRSSMSMVALVIWAARADRRSRWKAGCMRRRWRRHSGPSLTRRPSAMARLKVLLIAVALV
jgi:hypothetical protein